MYVFVMALLLGLGEIIGCVVWKGHGEWIEDVETCLKLND